MSTGTLPAVFLIDDSKSPDAKLILTQVNHPSNSIYLLTFSSPPDNRYTPAFIQAWLDALDFVETRLLNTAVLITTSAHEKFYSNGFDLQAIRKVGDHFMKNWFHKLMIRLLTFPRPTVALLNGHCFAAGLMTAMAQDYRVMNDSKGWCCMNEVDLGIELDPGMASIFREKLSPQVFRSVILEGHRFNGPESFQAGIVDALGGMAEALELIEERKMIGKGQTGVFGALRDEMWRETIRLFERYPGFAGTQRDEVERKGLHRWSKL